MNLATLQDIKSTHKSQLLFYALNNEQTKTDIMKTIPLTIASEWSRDLGINLTKEAKALYTENYKMLLKESKNTNKWKDIPYS